MLMRKLVDQCKDSIETLSGLLRRRSRKHTRSPFARAWSTAKTICVALGLFFYAGRFSFAYTVVQVSSSTPESIEQQFIANTTSQFNAVLFTNPFAQNTFQITLFGVNPNYIPKPPPTSVFYDTTTFQSDLVALVQESTNNYVNGWGDAVDYERAVDLSTIGNFGLNCSSSSTFVTAGTSTTTWDQNTCNAVVSSIYQSIFTAIGSTVPLAAQGL